MDRVRTVGHARRRRARGLCADVPDVVIEVVSKTDRPSVLRAKLERARVLGARYVLLLDPYRNERWSDGVPPPGLQLTLESIRI